MGPVRAKDVYESLDTMYAGLPQRLREEFIELMKEIAAKSDSYHVVRRWAKDHGQR